MSDAQDAHTVGMDSIEDRVWKALQMSLASPLRCLREGLWIVCDLRQDTFDLLKVFITKVVLALIIPSTSIIHFALNSDVVGQLHDRRRFEK